MLLLWHGVIPYGFRWQWHCPSTRPVCQKQIAMAVVAVAATTADGMVTRHLAAVVVVVVVAVARMQERVHSR